MARLDGKVVIVVGAGASGAGMSNGRAAALAYAREGAKVLAIDADAASLEVTRTQVAAEGGDCAAFTADVTSSASVRAAVEFAQDSFGGAIDVLHNNVGVIRSGGPVELDEADWDWAVSTNLKSMFLTCKYVIPVMESQRRGVITNIGSIAGLRYTGAPMLAYSTTKGAIPAFTRSVALQYAATGIRANCLHPGAIDTPMQEGAARSTYGKAFGESDLALLRARREAAIPMGRLGTPFEVASVAVFLASDEASYITGAEIMVDGGYVQLAG
ncbi:SDR family NAD(P)-dependent oxidoreductase [Mangrovicella endophytica]|uniref:SDR family NAD(P)-dependent oxidoreductase n=1 Tax=Mangrovicella endophytica TaxID=2066697 RepID=UPI000C9DEC79|nr:SDR family NAD(P)-dependent oxidoreductase [Mangrovicella endophytica]